MINAAQRAFIVGLVTHPTPTYLRTGCPMSRLSDMGYDPVQADQLARAMIPLPSPIKSTLFTHQFARPKLFFTLLLSKIACQAPQPTQNPVTRSI